MWSTADIPDQSGRVAVITGANTGLGLSTARELARAGATVVLAVRSLDKGKAAVETITRDVSDADVHVQALDLSSLDSVREAASALTDRWDRLDLLVNNAGVMYPPFQRTADGFELQFGVNHLGHFALTGLLLDRLTATSGSRIVNVSSQGHRARSAIDLATINDEKGYDRVAAYGRSKLANLLFTYALQRRLTAAGSATIAVVAHPGVSDTELSRHLPSVLSPLMPVFSRLAQSADAGAEPQLRAATDPETTGGTYYGPSGPGEVRGRAVVVASSERSHDHALQEALWTYSEDATRITFAF